MRSGICLVILVFLTTKFENYDGLRIKSEYDSYTSNSDVGSSSSFGNPSSEVFENRNKHSYGPSAPVSADYQSDYSQVEKEEDENEDENDEVNIVKSDDGTETETTERSVKKGLKQKEEDTGANANAIAGNLSKIQYDSKQAKFDLSSTLYPRSDVSGTNYVFLSPAAQRRIDKKIVQLRKKGKHHGSMKETIAVGEWQRLYYKRPVSEVQQFPEVSSRNIYGRKEGSLFNWVILVLVIILILVIFVFIYRSSSKE
ncbi:transmembrane protein [Cryptosporidium ryanae]|uniref:uncharacterized protein n=1 Tax=Cryptosporidium ryanae TaxID=515981 RepID=UPI00351A7D6E|nr:transmembrane protein [Cryptosporidium ryanae]